MNFDETIRQKIKNRLETLETELSTPEVSSDRQRFQELMTEHARQKRMLAVAEPFLDAQRKLEESKAILQDEDGDADLVELARMELEEAEADLPKLEKQLMIALLPPNPNEDKNTIVEIRAGTGGDEAALFAGDLYRMYTRFAEQKGWKATLLEASASEVGGYKEIIFSLEGTEVYKLMQYESGVHRVQRIPATEASGRIHTSAATVAVLPEAEEVDIDLKPEEIRVDVYRSSGPGGQSVNTTDSAIRLTHIPTGLVVTCQDEKSQHKNKAKAMRVLKARLYDMKLQEEQAKMASERKSQVGSGDRSERIRTYNYPQNRVTDHRINLTLYSLDRIMEGELDDVVDAMYDFDIQERLKEGVSEI